MQCCRCRYTSFFHNRSFLHFHGFPFAKFQSGFFLTRVLSILCMIDLCFFRVVLRFCFLFSFLIRKLSGLFLLFLMTEIHTIRIHLVHLICFPITFHGSTSFLISKFQTLFLFWLLTAAILLVPAVPSGFWKIDMLFLQSSRLTSLWLFCISGFFSSFCTNPFPILLLSALSEILTLFLCPHQFRCIPGFLHRGTDIFPTPFRLAGILIHKAYFFFPLFSSHLHIACTVADTNRRFFCQVFFHQTIPGHFLDFLIPDFHSLFCHCLLLLLRISFACL